MTAFHTHPFDLPAGTTPEDPPSNFWNLCVKAVRADERLRNANRATALTPRGHISAPLPRQIEVTRHSGPQYSYIPFPAYIFGTLVVYLSRRGLMVIADLTNEQRRLEIPTETIERYQCQILNDNVTLRIVRIGFQGFYTEVDDYDIRGEQVSHVQNYRGPPLHPNGLIEPLINGDNVFLGSGSNLYVINVKSGMRIRIMLEGELFSVSSSCRSYPIFLCENK